VKVGGKDTKFNSSQKEALTGAVKAENPLIVLKCIEVLAKFFDNLDEYIPSEWEAFPFAILVVD
jgi:hypothetical protein